MHTTSTADLRRQNRHQVLRAIADAREASRTEIAERIGLTNAAVSRITRELVDAGLVREVPVAGRKRQAGRPQIQLELVANSVFVIGVAITLNQKEVVLANGAGAILARRNLSGLSLANPSRALHKLGDTTAALIDETAIPRDRLLGGAALIAGRIAVNTGALLDNGPLGWSSLFPADLLRRHTGLPFIAEGRAAALLQAEAQQGCVAGLQDALLVNVGLRFGSALMLDGALVRGANHRAGQLGAYPCGSGNLDSVASGDAILRALSEGEAIAVDGPADPGQVLRQLVEAENLSPETDAVLSACGGALGRALRSLATVLRPQTVVLAGLVGRHPTYVKAAGEAAKDATLPGTEVDLDVSSLTSTQAAAWLALDHHLFHEPLFHERFDPGQPAAAGALAAA